MSTIANIKASYKKDGTDEREFSSFKLPVMNKQRGVNGKAMRMDTETLNNAVNKDFPKETGNLGKPGKSASFGM